MADFDVATTIAEFVADPERTALQLPHMTTGQRKNTKKLLEQYPELLCESFGFGAERQLHLFKPAEGPLLSPLASPRSGEIASPDQSTTAASDATNTSTKGSPFGGSPFGDSPVKHEELQVRNTFIHIESATADERAVQSMPHGMFRQCILSEALQGAAPRAIPTSSSEPEAEPMAGLVEQNAKQDSPLSPGALVMVEGLVKAPAFNGRSAVVQAFDEVTGRYSILIASSCGCQQAKVKEENLRMILPCP